MPSRESARARLFVFPYAGAGPSIFRTWHENLPEDIEVCAIQLPGREERITEVPCDDFARLVAAVSDAICAKVDGPFGLFGHSFGAVLAFACAERLCARELLPSVLMLSGRQAPQLTPRFQPLHGLSDASFLEMVSQRYRAIPAALLKEPEILQLVLPVLRADITLAERHHLDARLAPPLPIPIQAFGGTRDHLVSEEDLAPWAAKSSRGFELEMFDGDHFYLNDVKQKPRLLRAIAHALARGGNASAARGMAAGEMSR